MNYKKKFLNECGVDLLDTETVGKFPYRKGDKWSTISRGQGWKMYSEWLEEQVKNNDSLHSVSYSVAQQYAEFCIRCDREKLPLIKIEDYLKQL